MTRTDIETLAREWLHNALAADADSADIASLTALLERVAAMERERADRAEKLLRDLEPTIAYAIAHIWTPNLIAGFTERLAAIRAAGEAPK